MEAPLGDAGAPQGWDSDLGNAIWQMEASSCVRTGAHEVNEQWLAARQELWGENAYFTEDSPGTP